MTPECVLVTGTSGYLGSRIAGDLVLRGYEVLGLDILPPGGASIQPAGYRFLNADITRPETLPLETKQASILVHCAALVHRKSKDLSRENYFRVNQLGTRNLLLALDPSRLRRIVFLSTVSIYGDLNQGSVPDERTPPKPVDDYGASKVAAEVEIRAFSGNFAASHTILRLGPVYGRDFLLNIRKRIFLPGRAAFFTIGDGGQRLSMSAAGNVVAAVRQAVEEPGTGLCGVFNLKDREDYSINSLIGAMRQLEMRPHLPVIRIPRGMIMPVAIALKKLFPKSGAYLTYQLRKIAMDSVYSGQKLFATGVNLPWNMAYELFGRSIPR